MRKLRIIGMLSIFTITLAFGTLNNAIIDKQPEFQVAEKAIV
ncbi:hypothetical protein [Bacillus changyiensis]|nr:hypothetical protein [Bacillus changyiensis]MDA1477813.1 hypothetical protein [Bacillus changyiensis]